MIKIINNFVFLVACAVATVLITVPALANEVNVGSLVISSEEELFEDLDYSTSSGVETTTIYSMDEHGEVIWEDYYLEWYIINIATTKPITISGEEISAVAYNINICSGEGETADITLDNLNLAIDAPSWAGSQGGLDYIYGEGEGEIILRLKGTNTFQSIPGGLDYHMIKMDNGIIISDGMGALDFDGTIKCKAIINSSIVEDDCWWNKITCDYIKDCVIDTGNLIAECSSIENSIISCSDIENADRINIDSSSSVKTGNPLSNAYSGDIKLYLTKFYVGSDFNGGLITVNGITSNFLYGHENDEYIYLYLPEGNNALICNEDTYISSTTSDNTSVFTEPKKLNITVSSPTFAQVREDGGIRFSNTLEKDVNFSSITEKGTLIIPKRVLLEKTGETDVADAIKYLTKENADFLDALDITCRNVFSETDNQYSFTAVLTNIPEEANGDIIIVKSYVKYKNSDNIEQYTYGQYSTYTID